MEETIKDIIKESLIQHFDLSNENFDWNVSLVKLHPKFHLLAYLLEWQQILSVQFHQEILLVGKVNAQVHDANDIVQIVKNQLQS
ncbi:MAG: hypothetical protein AAF599_13565 [Bacteroidota bacterium]